MSNAIEKLIPKAEVETLKQDIQQWQNKQPEYKDFNAGVGKLLREIELVDRLCLGGFLERLECIAFWFPHGSLEREKLLKAHQDFFEAIKSKLIRRASMSLRGVTKTLDLINRALSGNEQKRETSAKESNSIPARSSEEQSIKQITTLKRFIETYCDLRGKVDVESKVNLIYHYSRDHKRDKGKKIIKKKITLPIPARPWKEGQKKYFYVSDLIKLWSTQDVMSNLLPLKSGV